MSPSRPAPNPTTPGSAPNSTSAEFDPVIVPVFDSNAYRAFKAWPKERTAACVHACQVYHPRLHRRLSVYAKMYWPAGDSQRGLLNEITAYVFGRYLGAPVSDRAFVCFIPLKKLKSPRPFWISSLLKKDKEADYPAFCTSAMAGGDAVIRYDAVGPKLFAEDLRRWPELHLATSFDQHITNTDRHLGNLRRIRKHSYRLFDHGRLVTAGGNWRRSDLLDAEKQKRPDALLKKAWPDGCPNNAVSEILAHLGYHSTAISLALPELRWWWSRLTLPDDADGFERYLVNRAKELIKMYQREYNLLPFE